SESSFSFPARRAAGSPNPASRPSLPRASVPAPIPTPPHTPPAPLPQAPSLPRTPSALVQPLAPPPAYVSSTPCNPGVELSSCGASHAVAPSPPPPSKWIPAAVNVSAVHFAIAPIAGEVLINRLGSQSVVGACPNLLFIASASHASLPKAHGRGGTRTHILLINNRART